MTTEQSPEPRIYVASLSDYNAGRLLGRWIHQALVLLSECKLAGGLVLEEASIFGVDTGLREVLGGGFGAQTRCSTYPSVSMR